MIRKRSLGQVLARQWIVFGLVLFAGFAAISLLFLYMLEDRFINGRLREAALDVVTLAKPPALPSRFELMSFDQAQPALRERMDPVRQGGIREFTLPDGRYVHVFSGRDLHGTSFLLTYDVSDQLNVNRALTHGWPWLLLAAAALAMIAFGLARRFVGQVTRQARELVVRVMEADGPQKLHALANDEAIGEFSVLARLSAEAWEARLSALDRERETLAFLGHELRTPLQSARTSLALLNEDRDDTVAWQRLQRAQDRLVRATHAVLWLGAGGPVATGVNCEVSQVVEALVAEFAPLASARQQSIESAVDAAACWPLPAEVVETVLANLLLNAIQHGGPGQIRLQLDGEGMRLVNPASATPEASGFGLGLELVQRLLERFNWCLARGGVSEHVVRIGPSSALQ